jgi:phosphatidate cytidylyltransferase
MYYLGLIFESAYINLNFFTIVMIVLLLLSLMGVYVLTFPKFHADQVMAALFSFVYCPVLMSFIYRARCLPYGVYVYALIFFCTWICDTCAYFAGRAFGKHKMAPVLSPKKTIEGFFGGIIGSAVLCFLLSIFLKWQHPEEPASFGLTFTIIGLVGGTVSAIGDLAASAIKRDHNIKDYGNCIPGHGGIMDRFDSVIFTTPIIYFLAVLLMQTK